MLIWCPTKKSFCNNLLAAVHLRFQLLRSSTWLGLLLLLNLSSAAAPGPRKARLSKVLGADISFLPRLETRGIKFSDNGMQKNAIQILKDHHFNYIRPRIFNNPSADSGFAPGKGYCNLPHTLAMAKRVKQARMKLLLDFHYRDTWAAPQKQLKPVAWKGLSGPALIHAVHDYTKSVLLALAAQGTSPDMVRIGNEIIYGMIWPDGNLQLPYSLARFDTLANLAEAGASAVRETTPKALVMTHIALGGQNRLSTRWLDRMIARKVQFDVIGELYYPKWHGTLADLKFILADLAKKYPQDTVVLEYSDRKPEIHDIAFSLPGGKGKGSFIWSRSTPENLFSTNRARPMTCC